MIHAWSPPFASLKLTRLTLGAPAASSVSVDPGDRDRRARQRRYSPSVLFAKRAETAGRCACSTPGDATSSFDCLQRRDCSRSSSIPAPAVKVLVIADDPSALPRRSRDDMSSATAVVTPKAAWRRTMRSSARSSRRRRLRPRAVLQRTHDFRRPQLELGHGLALEGAPRPRPPLRAGARRPESHHFGSLRLSERRDSSIRGKAGAAWRPSGEEPTKRWAPPQAGA